MMNSKRKTISHTFGLLLNLAGVCNTEDKDVLWGFITRYAPDASPQNDAVLDELVGRAINYYRDFVKPTKKYRAPSVAEASALGATPLPAGFVGRGPRAPRSLAPVRRCPRWA